MGTALLTNVSPQNFLIFIYYGLDIDGIKAFSTKILSWIANFLVRWRLNPHKPTIDAPNAPIIIPLDFLANLLRILSLFGWLWMT